jgi:hypothetical protein
VCSVQVVPAGHVFRIDASEILRRSKIR